MTERSQKRTFTKKLSRRIETQIQAQKQKRKALVSMIMGKTSNLIILLASIVLIAFFWQQKVLFPLLTFSQALGGDYFNALTYAKFITSYLPFPPTGWMPFWNGGIPVIGGYFTAFFYLLYPLVKFFDVATSMELASAITLLLFLIFSHALFWEISRNHVIALIFTMIIGLNPATYYSLVDEGLVVGTAMQWSLPLTLFLIVRFIKFQQFPLLLIASAVTGIAFILHPAMGLLTVFIPGIIYLITANTGDPQDAEHTMQLELYKPSTWIRLKTKLSHASIFLLISGLAGITGLYSLVIQSILSTGSLPCNSNQCWGDYPQHFSWFTPLLLPPIIIYTATAVFAWIKENKRFSEVLAPLLAILPLILYLLAAWLHLIDPIASAFFPRRLFWAISVLVLAVAASSLRFSTKISPNLSIGSIAFLIIAFSLLIPNRPDSLHYYITLKWAPAQALPFGLEQYLVPKYQISNPQELIPPWLPTNETNYRIESIRPDFFIWWNVLSNTPSTRGYSNIPIQQHQNWLYYMQTATQIQDPQEKLSSKTVKDRAFFLLDAFAVKFIHHTPGQVETGLIGYDPLIIEDESLIKQSQTIRDWTFFELNDQATSPIITPSNASRILVVSDNVGYESLIRALSLTALNNKQLITIKAPKSINKLSKNLLDNVDSVVLYRFTGSDWQLLEEFIDSGGNIFVDFGSLDNVPQELPDFLGIFDLQQYTSLQKWNFKTHNQSPLLLEVFLDLFSPPLFENKPWKIISPMSQQNTDPQTNVILSSNNMPILLTNDSQKGHLIFSGFNLPYHAVRYQNEHEAQLLENIFRMLTEEPESISEFSLQRPNPSIITLSTRNAKGILFKENFHPGWTAEINGKAAPIYKASFDFMYLPIPKSKWLHTNQIIFKFTGSIATWILPAVSLFTVLLIALYTIIPAPFKWLNKLLYKKITRPASRWWTKDQTKY